MDYRQLYISWATEGWRMAQMTSEQRLQVANEINRLWVRHTRCGERPPDLRQVARTHRAI
jgi:hypothetical protein